MGMWLEHYRKTFVRMQITILLVTASVYVFFGQFWQRAAIFFLFMEVSSVIGAVWATRFKAMATRAQSLPLRPAA
jgi:hypothetical protein